LQQAEQPPAVVDVLGRLVFEQESGIRCYDF
jgi:hypothetical protein